MALGTEHRLFEQQRIEKDEWVLEQLSIPAEAWGIGIIGTAGLLFVGWRLFVRKSHEHITATT